MEPRQETPETAYIGIGANLGDRLRTMCRAVRHLAAHPRVHIEVPHDLASVFETEAVGGPAGQPRYLNSALRIRTTLRPAELLGELFAIEAHLGRVRGGPGDARLIDLDLLLYGYLVLESVGLRIPHPRLCARLFVLLPLTELAGDVQHPVVGTTIRSLLWSAGSVSQGQCPTRILTADAFGQYIDRTCPADGAQRAALIRAC